MEPIKLLGNLTISRVTGTDTDFITLSIIDETSGNIAVKVSLDHASFSKALMGQGCMKCSLDYFPQNNIGKKRDIRKVFVPFPLKFSYMKTGLDLNQAKREAVKPFEVDGWEINDLTQLGNPHCSAISPKGEEGYVVHLVKYS